MHHFFGFTICGLISTTLAGDPASSWLSYAQYADPNGGRITALNTTWIVPSYPTVNFGSNAPGWWFGIQTADGEGALIQPILAWGYKGKEFDIFNGVYDWNIGAKSWTTSDSCTVAPGDLITSSVTLAPGTSTYTMEISTTTCGAITMDKEVANNSGENESVAYFVLEHQPFTCAAYPASGEMSFENIYMEVEYKAVAPEWESGIGVNACDSAATIIDSETIEFSWSTIHTAERAGSDVESPDKWAQSASNPIRCTTDIASASTDVATATQAIISAVDDCQLEDYSYCETDIDTAADAFAHLADDINSAVRDCGTGEENVCGDDIVEIIYDAANATEFITAAVFDCADTSTALKMKRCIDDCTSASLVLAQMGVDIAQAAGDC